ncbi:rod shape-determining protein MreD [Vagococcus coleopterorum]|uniref:Rod shape-determining protein MreD n=1 Tax=Vagococcus coleopterorum TaxID=2714946 RepID=A0A6G8ALF3_9ENTE|nr:rod shape-determining protein MreD [Vagococcus coleopterorum]QIL45888.1 rod shape-determining protein MreD [Vagococcus coleopterorum]
MLPVLLFILTLLDGQLSRGLRSVMTNQAFLNSHLLLIALILASIWYSKRYMVITSMFIGLLFDIYYYGIIGINMVVLPLTVLLVYLVFKHVPINMLSIILGLIVFITIMDSSAYLLQVVFNLRTPGVARYVVGNLGPTLMFNIVACLLLSFPINKFLKKANV